MMPDPFLDAESGGYSKREEIMFILRSLRADPFPYAVNGGYTKKDTHRSQIGNRTKTKANGCGN